MQLQSGMRAVVLGLGTAGLATVDFLLHRNLRVAVSDLRHREQIDAKVLAYLEEMDVPLETGGHTAAFCADADLLVPGPGVPLDLPVLRAAREQGLPVVGELALAAGRFRAPVIAVTGSNGKTTVTSLIGTLLQAAGATPFIGGNIGTPLLEYFINPDQYDVVVLELSSFQLDLAGSFRPDTGVLLNISPDHLDRHGSLEAYTAAKLHMFSKQQAGDIAVLGDDDPVVAGIVPNSGVLSFRFGVGPLCTARIEGGSIQLHVQHQGQVRRERYDLRETKLHSLVNRLNAAAALLVAVLHGSSREAINRGLAAFTPPPHRMNEVAVIAGVRFINDSKATNVGALRAALSSCSAPVILIAGGRDKGGDYLLLRDVVAQRVKHLVLLGEAAPLMTAALGEIVPTQSVVSMDEAVRASMTVAEDGDIVLLAPGCASFDMFSGYMERGQAFCESVHRLQQDQMVEGEI
ncbi:UDP-N-acetylmuramoyl-L-alanine--D-glutamate ligase [Desulfobulbus alkaliphilus]|uniref:UDP-N-acetylmuramoyl-L-alanine--D-glutamate ligase n=1 Tax=Desulfobulbus alkaliphilus TaxID=869814 RepID=UPI00196380F3|nr:UDP-N-acetylmuramoyl-L-alanine--D-glutamate ligase [Desulfobulbus alkaliphilus]MBM9536029.1 UDP-N-acetylmuramoyl-L-alanine--D-glutamate ligase [Desulfobulbus alkaliphilus]